jgi:transposase-like protein
MKMDKKKENISKEAIVAEYLTGSITYRGLEAKYGIPSRSICDWVLEYQGRKPSWKEKKRRSQEIKGVSPEPELPKDVKILQDALRKSQLKSELLEEMLKLSEDYTGVDLRKKFGAKR